MTTAAYRLIKTVVILLICGKTFCQENPLLPVNNEGGGGGMPMAAPGAGLFGGINPFVTGENEQPSTLPYMQQGSRFDMTPNMLGILRESGGISPFAPGENQPISGQGTMFNPGIPSPNLRGSSLFRTSPPIQPSMFANILKGVPKANTLIFFRILNSEFGK